MGLDRVNIINSINEAQLLSDMRSKKARP
jgi:hypothetical protein